MPEQNHPPLSLELEGELQHLGRRGYTLIPLGGSDGKTPKIGNWAKSEVKVSQCRAIMNRTGSSSYGVRLDRMIVLDIDTQDADLLARLEERFGPAKVQVRSPRGMHLYYAEGGAIPALKAEGLPVDVKTGPHAFVVGPHSVRPDGGCYAYLKGRLGEVALTPLRMQETAGGVGPVAQRRLPEVGSRHVWLRAEALNMVEFVNSLDELIGNLEHLRYRAPDPESMPVSEVRGIAEWAWKCRLENRLFAGRNSAVKLNRNAIDALRHEPDALALYAVLCDAHGHTSPKRFALSHPGMVKAERIILSRDRFRAARDTLVRKGLLQLVAKHQAGKRSQQFVLCRLSPDGGEEQNVTRPQFG